MFNIGKTAKSIQAGIDIGSAFIKAAVIDKTKTSPQLAAFSCEPLGEDKVASLKNAVAKSGIANIPVNTSISGPSTIVRIIEMPNMSEKELKNAVKFEAEKYIPYKIDEVISDCVKIGESAKGKITVMLAAVKKSVISDRMELFQKAGLTLNAIDVDSFAVLNAFLNTREEKQPDAAFALVNIGSKITNIGVIDKDQPHVVRDIQIAGSDITDALCDRLSVDRKKAEELKAGPGEFKDETTSIIKSVFLNLVNEIRISLDYYENHYGKNVQKIYLSGGSAKIYGIADFIKDVFSGDVIAWDPFKNIGLDSKIDRKALEPIKSSFAVAVGLALREG